MVRIQKYSGVIARGYAPTKALFTSQVFLGLRGEITGPRANPETSRTGRLLLRYISEISRPNPEHTDPLSPILRFSHTRAYPRVFGRGRARGRRRRLQQATATRDGGGKGDGGRERTSESQRLRRAPPPATGPRSVLARLLSFSPPP